ncbi:MAG: stage II sporulation protein D [Bacilli bacterium]|nr:stage II sporulation protein D [Bacilli bacterium]
MKKLIFTTILIILIPYIFISIFIREPEEIKFKYMSNMTIRIKRSATGVIDVVPIEEYIVGVVSGEVPISFEMDALKAQAVAARSYVLKQLEYNRNNDYDVVDTVMNQVYLDSDQLKNRWGNNYITNLNKAKMAVLETKGEYLDCNGSVVEALFFSTSTGYTENSGEVFPTQQPYLKSVASTWDADVSPVFNDYFYFKLWDFYSKLGLPYSDTLYVEAINTTSTGRIKQVKINGKIFSGDDVQYLLGLRSTFFSIIQNGEDITVNTKGYGHGVGMSQYGAQGMALNGYKYDEILKYYYQGVEIKKIY